MPNELKKRVSAVFETKLVEQVKVLGKINRRSFSAMLEILVSEAIKQRSKK